MHWNPAVGIPLIIIGLIVLALIWLFGQPRKPKQGRRTHAVRPDARREPTLGTAAGDHDASPAAAAPAGVEQPQQGELAIEKQARRKQRRAAAPDAQLETAPPASPATDAAPAGKTTRAPAQDPESAAAPAPMPASALAPASTLGQRPADSPVERIVSLFVVAREGHTFHGSDLVVAMEKAGLEFGAMQIFHRLLDGKAEQGAVFSVANMVKPGNFDMTSLDAVQTPGVSFFMTLPGPLSALDAWDTMLPTAQRLAKLLEGQVLDEERNALGRQRIAYIRDDLRRWDRRHEVV